MCRSLNDINSLRPITNQKDGNIIKSKIVEHIKSFQFEDSYINNSDLKILEYSENVYHSLTLDNFSDNRFFTTEAVPNVSGYQISRKFTNEFNPWDYHLTFNKEFSGSNDSRIIEESHHAQGCSTCNQHGKLRCYACNGAGENTCSNCYGKGQLRCSNCDGKGETRCFWCSGKGTKTKTEYRNGQSYSTQERCSHCSGRGNNPCSSCRGGYVNCSTCSATGKVACYVCMSSGEITCHTCEGYKTLDNYFIVNSTFKDQSQELIISQPSAGYNLSKAVSNNFQISNLLLELIEPRFKNGHFESLNSNKSYSTIVEFFNFIETPFSKLIKSRLAVFENTYNRIKYEFYGEKYDIFFDKNFQNYYYNGRKPSDQYEIDLLKRLIQEVKSNSLIEAKTTLEKFSQSNFLNIGEQKIVDSISYTENIYEAVDLYTQRKYTGSENIIKNLPDERTKLSDVKTLRRYLNRTYFFNTTIFWLASLIPLGYLILNPQLNLNQYVTGQAGILFSSFALFIICLSNIPFKNIHFSRYVIVCINLIICGLITVKVSQPIPTSYSAAIDSTKSIAKREDTTKNIILQSTQDSAKIISDTTIKQDSLNAASKSQVSNIDTTATTPNSDNRNKDPKLSFKNYYQSVLEKYNKNIQNYQHDAGAYDDMGRMKFELQDYQGAITDYNKSISINPKWNSKMAYVDRAIAKAKIQDYKGAIEDYNKVDAHNYSVVNYNRADAKFELHDYQGAIADYDEVLKGITESNPNDYLRHYLAELYQKRGLAKHQIGINDGACSDWKKAFEFGSKDAGDEISKFCN